MEEQKPKIIAFTLKLPENMDNALSDLKKNDQLRKQFYGAMTRNKLIRLAISQFIQRNKVDGNN